MKANPDLCQSNLWQIPVPADCVNKTFEYLFLTLLQQRLISLGLYRTKWSTDNNYPYVYTNPSHDTIITHRDKVFVLGVEIPKDLSLEYNETPKDKEIDLDPEVDNGKITFRPTNTTLRIKGARVT